MNVGSMLKSDLYKYFHTPVWIWHLVIPVAGAGVFVWYDSFSVMQEMDKVSLYIETLAAAFPFIIGMITGLVSQVEQNAAGSQLLLVTPTHKFLPHFSKLLIVLLMGFGSAFLAVTMFGMGFRALGYTGLRSVFYVKCAAALFSGMIPLYLIHYMVSFLLGNMYSIGLGVAGSLVSALLMTGLGDSTWWFQPWGFASRSALNCFMAERSGISYFQYPFVKQSIIVLVVLSAALILLGGILLGSWEGRKTEN